ncbi:MAG: hypothetical protein HYS53_01935 [Candidatus Aenigmarchaeota archaeon]|nr:hypothetical protein [Candidatus Aenigmarchaeota archaeon]
MRKMQINNLQRMVEGLQINDGELKTRIKELASRLESNEDEAVITEMIVMLSRLASKNKMELEAAHYKRMDEMRKQTS